MGIRPNQALLIYSKISNISEISHFLSLPKNLQKNSRNFPDHFFWGVNESEVIYDACQHLCFEQNEGGPSALEISKPWSLLELDCIQVGPFQPLFLGGWRYPCNHIDGHVWTNYAQCRCKCFCLAQHPWIGTWGSSSMIGGDSWGGNQAHFVDLRDPRTMPKRDPLGPQVPSDVRCAKWGFHLMEDGKMVCRWWKRLAMITFRKIIILIKF